MNEIISNTIFGPAVAEAIQNLVYMGVLGAVGWLAAQVSRYWARLANLTDENAALAKLEKEWRLRTIIERAALTAIESALLEGATQDQALDRAPAVMRASVPEAIRDIAPAWDPVTDATLRSKAASALFEYLKRTQQGA